MSFLFIALFLAIVWSLITASFDLGNFLLGLGLATAALIFVRGQTESVQFFRRWRKAVHLTIVFLKELVVSAVRVAILVLSPNIKKSINPGIIAYPLKLTDDFQISLLANLITLTPGTLSIDTSDDKKYLYIHAIDVVDKKALCKEIETGFERMVMEVFE